ncbi:type 2 lanthipeptide synthetase LanM family protein [Allokutzneria albata]|uniref:Type 2 lantibiotic biosynthesis protein LanM n=1 Tax=Allokutzneria albata TaxID=211114 RepID=A0A1G9Y013_ALLAB|nr:type 2 lanthipeptide synthetase LanM family protein [Allokutzneria albata]SDN02394.1 type 2 lantibiotic biosynthesis protein LanM [Allokutzneria albata]
MGEVRERSGAIDFDDSHRALGARLADRAAAPFAALADPLVGWAFERLVESAPGTRGPRNAHRWAELLLPALSRRLNGMAQRTCLVELASAREQGLLPGDDSASRFASFLIRIADERQSVLDRYPVLERQLTVVTDLWVAQAVEFSERLERDLPDLVERFADGTDPGAVVDVRMGLGDPHRGARTVSVVEFESGLRCVYKPRSLASDVHFQALLEWVNERLDGLELPTLRCVDRGEYGWTEFVEAADCGSGEAAARLFHRYGGLLAVLYLVHAGDCHSENLIVSGERPFLVDVETVFQPVITSLRSESASAAEMAASAMCEGSVLFSGLLPVGARPADSTELAGLGSSAVAPRPGAALLKAAVVGAGTDRMRIEFAPQPSEPVAPSRTPRPIEHLDDIVSGFAETYQVFVRHRAELVDPSGPIAAFSADRVRCVVRDTMVYGLLLSTSFHPSLLRDVADRERHFDRLHTDVLQRPGLAAFVDAEQRDMRRNDVPLFTVGVDGGPVCASDGEPLSGVIVQSGMSITRDVLDRLGPDDLELQTWLIRTAVTSETIRSELTVARQRHESAPAAHPADRARIAAGADAVAEKVAALAISADDEAVWLGCSTGRTGNYAVGILGTGFYDGLTGIATFLAHHGKLRDCRESTRLAAEAARAAVRRIEHAPDTSSLVGLQGTGGLVYGLAQLHALAPQLGLLERALGLAKRLRADVLSDEQFEVMGGAAGAIFGLAALHSVRPDAVVRDAIAAAADRLVSAQRPCAVGAGWTAALFKGWGVAPEPLGGFAHGVSGVAAALAVAADVLGDARCDDAMRAALAYEAHLFDTEAGDWKDVRRDIATDLVVSPGDDDPDRSVAWCHGAPGIGIARHIILDVVDDLTWRDELSTAAAITLRSGFGNDHSLCHGDLGNLDFLLLAARRDPALTDAIHRQAAAVLDGVDQHGWRCGLHTNLVGSGLFTGLAGIGYGLLRLLDPETVPSVLALEPLPRR